MIDVVESKIMKEFNPSRNLCMMAAILLPMTAEQQEWLRLGGGLCGCDWCSLIASLGGYNVSRLTRYNRYNTPRFQF